MSSINDNAIDAIIKGISDALKSNTEKLPMTKVFSSPIYGVNSDGTYTIIKEKNKYNVKNGLSSALSLGQNVWIIIPNGSLKDMFICGLNKNGTETYVPSDDVDELVNLVTQLNKVVNGHTTSIEGLNSDVNEMEVNLSNHIDNEDIHVTSEEKADYDKAVANSHIHSNKTVLDTITSDKIEEWNNAEENVQSDWNVIDTTSDAYIKNKPTIPSIEGLATEEYVKDVVKDKADKSDISNHNTSIDSHNDIRDLITGLTSRLNALADSDDTTLDQMSEIVAYIKANKTLIDSVTTSKINVSDIINNLTTNVSTKPLAASQGVVIKALIDALKIELDSHVDDDSMWKDHSEFITQNYKECAKIITRNMHILKNIILSGYAYRINKVFVDRSGKRAYSFYTCPEIDNIKSEGDRVSREKWEKRQQKENSVNEPVNTDMKRLIEKAMAEVEDATE